MTVQGLIDLLQLFEKKDSLEQIGIVSGLASPLIGAALGGWALIQRRYRKGLDEHVAEIERLKRKADDLGLKASTRAKLNDEQAATIKALRARLPETLIAEAEEERREGNDELAVSLCRRLIDDNGPVLAGAAAEVASFHLAAYEPPDDPGHLVAAERFATLTLHLDPKNPVGSSLFADARALRSDRSLDAGDLAETVRDWGEAYAFAFTEREAGERLPHLLSRAAGAITQGRYAQALAMASVAVRLSRRSFGPTAELTLSARYWLALALQRLGRAREALAEIEGGKADLLALSIKVWGAEHPGTLATRHLRATVQRDLGRYGEALAEIGSEAEGLLALSIKVQGAEHPDTLTTRHLRASVVRLAGEYEVADTELVSLQPRARMVFGPAHPRYARVLHELGVVRGQLGAADEAQGWLNEALAIRSAALGAEHPDTLLTATVLAALHRENGQADVARQELERILEASKRALGPDHPQTLTTMHELALAELAGGRRNAALQLLRLVIPGRERWIGVDHPDTVAARADLASLDRTVETAAPGPP